MFTHRMAGTLGTAGLAAGVIAAGVLPAQAVTARPAAASRPVVAAHQMDLRAGLHGSRAYPRVTGAAAYEPDHHGRQLEVHLYHAARLAGWRLVVYVHGTRAGTMTVSRYGYAHLARHRGVPYCQAGQAIRIRTRAGVLVASGTFRASHHYHH